MPILQAVFRKQNATLGQEMLELSYTSVTRAQVILGSISKLQSVLYVLCNVVLPYISANIRDCQQKRDFPKSYPRVSSGFPYFTIFFILSKLADMFEGVMMIIQDGILMSFQSFFRVFMICCDFSAAKPCYVFSCSYTRLFCV